MILAQMKCSHTISVKVRQFYISKTEGLIWYVNIKLENFFNVFKFVINRTFITKFSMDSYVIKPVDIVM